MDSLAGARAAVSRGTLVAPRDRADSISVSRRAPALSLFTLFALGILADHSLPTVQSPWIWAALVALAIGASWLLTGSPRGVLVSLAVSVFSLGGLEHRLSLAEPGPDHILRLVPDEGGPARFSGTVVERPVVIPENESRAAWELPEYERTRLIVDSDSWLDASRPSPDRIEVTGRVWIDVEGHLVGVSRGDRVEISARLYPPRGRANPGGFDFREYLARRGIFAAASCEQPEAVRVLSAEATPSWFQQFARTRDRLRDRVERVFQRELSPETSALALALLMGTRADLPDELRAAFARSGSMHLLAISGANVVVLAGVLWFVVAAVTRSRRIRLLVLMVGLAGYLWLTEWQAPVFRSVVMLELVLWGRLTGRSLSGWNSLGLAGIVGLFANPADLFEIGAQLSFLAVTGLLCAAACWRHFNLAAATDPGQVPRRRTVMSVLRRQALLWMTTTGAVWVFTLPLSLHQFHLFSGIGFFFGVILAPLSAALLAVGYLTMLAALTVTPLVSILGPLFDAALRLLMESVTLAARVPGGHTYIAGPSLVWTVGFYAILLGGVGWIRAGKSTRIPAWLISIWLLVAVIPWPAVGGSRAVTVTMLSVGHGGATLVHLPHGGTVLYDAGRLQDQGRAQEIIQQALWSAGKSRIDVVVLSHADIDHFNVLPGLLTSVPVGTVCVHPSFLREEQAAVRDLIETVRAANVPIRLVWRGDALALDPHVSLTILSPEPMFRGTGDNASSLVLELSAYDRRILLTGDLEGDGLAHFLAAPGPRVDVLQAPHHGAIAANTVDLERRTVPSWVWVSGGRNETAERLRSVYPTAEAILTTRDHGALTATISRDGQLRITSVGDGR